MKNPILVVSLVLLLCFTFGCQNKAEKAELEKFRMQAKVEEENRAIAIREWEAWNKGDFVAFKEEIGPEYVWYSPSGSTKPRTLEEMIAAGKMIHSSFPDVTFSIEEILVDGNKVIVRYIMRGTHQGEFKGLPATGNLVEVSGIMIHRIENGKIVEEREELDRLGSYQQLGMELKPKEIKK
jgi:steroid delta-isomerase-like uncharacterized protein